MLVSLANRPTMNDRPQPTDLVAGEISTAEPELSATEKKWQRWDASLLRGSQVLTMPPRKWIVRSWMPLDALIAIYAPPGAGKSFYAVTAALELAHGVEWIQPLSRPYRVLYVPAEKETDIRDRMEAWSVGTGRSIPDRFVMLPQRAQLGNEIDVLLLVRTIEQERIDVVILDTYAAMTAGIDENSSKDTGRVMEQLDTIRRATKGGTVIAVHHAGKDTTKGMRGSTAFLGAVDLSIELRPSDGSNIEARVVKANAGAQPMPEHYRLEPVALEPAPGDTDARSVPYLIHTSAPVLSGTKRMAILSLWRTHFNSTASTKEIEEALNDDGHTVSRGYLNKQLKAMCDVGQLTKSGSDTRPRYHPGESTQIAFEELG